MRASCLILLFNLGFIYCAFSDLNTLASNANKKCCDEVYSDNEDSKKQCLTALEKGYAGSYIEELILYSVNNKERKAKANVLEKDPLYKGRLNGLKGEAREKMLDELFKLPDVQAKVKADAEKAVKEQVDLFDKKIDALCKYEASILNGLTPDVFGFIVTSATGQFTQDAATKFTKYLAELDEDTRKKAMGLTTSFWQKLYSNVSNPFDKVGDYNKVILTDDFKKFNNEYTNWYDNDKSPCKIEDIVGMYQQYEDKIKTHKQENYKSLIEAEIRKCSEAAAKANPK